MAPSREQHYSKGMCQYDNQKKSALVFPSAPWFEFDWGHLLLILLWRYSQAIT
jgi:hypothetical protein